MTVALVNTKIAVVVRDDLPVWQRLNVAAFLVSGVASAIPELIGDPYEDADGTKYLAMFGQPVLVFEASAEVLSVGAPPGAERGLPMSIFTADLFATGNDEDNRAAVRAVAARRARPRRTRRAWAAQRRRQGRQGRADASLESRDRAGPQLVGRRDHLDAVVCHRVADDVRPFLQVLRGAAGLLGDACRQERLRVLVRRGRADRGLDRADQRRHVAGHRRAVLHDVDGRADRAAALVSEHDDQRDGEVLDGVLDAADHGGVEHLAGRADDEQVAEALVEQELR